MSPHWYVFTLRGWIAFLAFMNLGTAARCFIDHQFVHTKFFGTRPEDEGPHKDDAVVERLFGFWSIINGIIFLHCAVFIQESKMLGITACALLLYILFFASEIFVYSTIVLNGATLYPLAMAGLSLFWLIVSYTFIRRDLYDDIDENDLLRKSFPFKNVMKKMK